MSISAYSFGRTNDGKEVTAYLIENKSGLKAEILDLGCIVNKLFTPDKNGDFADVVLGCDNPQDHAKSPYFGAVIGRYGNRIKAGKFTLNGVEYQLNCNDNGNHLHGGNIGFNQKIWNVDEYDPDGNKLCFCYVSPDGEENYPGTLQVTVEYELGENYLNIHYSAETDKDTILNLTNHSYFNLAGHNAGKIDAHKVRILADQYSEADEQLILTGRDLSVEGTGYDLRELKSISEAMETGKNTPQMQSAASKGAFDTNYPLSKGGNYDLLAEVYEPESERVMKVYSDQPCVQFYSGNSMSEVSGKNGAVYGMREGLCLETQHYPDSPNFPQWPTTVLKAGEKFDSETKYQFSVRD